jgi:hypothetical protein
MVRPFLAIVGGHDRPVSPTAGVDFAVICAEPPNLQADRADAKHPFWIENRHVRTFERVD